MNGSALIGFSVLQRLVACSVSFYAIVLSASPVVRGAKLRRIESGA